MVFSINSAGKIGYLYTENVNFSVYHVPHAEINSERTINSNEKSKTKKLLQESAET